MSNMFLVGQLLLGLVGIHLFWIYFFITGTLVRQRQSDDGADTRDTPSDRMADLVITSAAGIAIIGFVVLICGFIGVLEVSALLVWLVGEALLFKLLRNENVFGATFWLRRFKVIRDAWSFPAFIIYGVFLAISVPALLPPIESDSVSYHLAYAVDWANAGQIYVDQFLRFPYYANNFVLIYALMFVLKLGHLCHFMTWLCGLLSSLGVYALISQQSASQVSGSRWVTFTRALTSTVLPLALALSPGFLRFVNVAYIDIPIGLFILIPILCTYSVLRGNPRNYELEMVFTAGFCVGMKISLFLCLPLFLLSLILLSHRQRKRPKQVLVLCALLLLLCAPWYLRNFIAVGDPIPPALNLMFRGHDPIFNQADYDGLKADLRPPMDASAWLLLPVNLFVNPGSSIFREHGTNLTVIWLYLPLLTMFLLVFKGFRRRVSTALIYLNVALIYLLINWLSVSSLGRYFLHLSPVYLSYLGVWISAAAFYLDSLAVKRKMPRFALQAPLMVLVVVMLYPSKGSMEYYRYILRSHYRDLSTTLKSREYFLRRYQPGYTSVQGIVSGMYQDGRQNQRVLVLGSENLAFYFRKHNIVSMGDWFGPGRHADLAAAIDDSAVASYLARFNIGAVLINLTGKRLSEQHYQSLIKQLERQNFTLKKLESGTAVYLPRK